MRFFDNDNNNPDAYYEPNSMNGPKQDESYKEPALALDGDADRYDHRVGNDDYTQPGNLFRLLKDDEQQRLFSNIAASMQGVPQDIIDRQLEHFKKADPAYYAGVNAALSSTPQAR